MIDWNRIFDSTPALIRATVVLVFSGVIVLFAIAIAGAVLSGQELQAWGFTIKEYHSPDVQKCAAVAANLQFVNTTNADALKIISEQIATKETFSDKYTHSAASINDKGGYSFIADRYREVAKQGHEDIAELLKKQDGIIAARNNVTEALKQACTPGGKS